MRAKSHLSLSSPIELEIFTFVIMIIISKLGLFQLTGLFISLTITVKGDNYNSSKNLGIYIVPHGQ